MYVLFLFNYQYAKFDHKRLSSFCMKELQTNNELIHPSFLRNFQVYNSYADFEYFDFKYSGFQTKRRSYKLCKFMLYSTIATPLRKYYALRGQLRYPFVIMLR